MNAPSFPFAVPASYLHLLRWNVLGRKSDGAFAPVHLTDERDSFCVTERWPHGPSKRRLYVFAEDQQNDDRVCFEVEEGVLSGVVRVHLQPPKGYDFDARYDSVWEWLKSQINEVGFCADTDPRWKESAPAHAFPIRPSPFYFHMREHRILVSEGAGPFDPWRLVDTPVGVVLREGGAERTVWPFAERDQGAEFFCFEIEEGEAASIVRVWRGADGYVVVKRFANTWDWEWFKDVVDEVAAMVGA